MSIQRKTRWKGKVLTFYCTAGDHYEPEEAFFRNRATKFRISSNCKGCSKGLAKTKYKASQSKRSEKYHLKRQTAMRRVKAFDAIVFELRKKDEEIKVTMNSIELLEASLKIMELHKRLYEI